MAPAKKTTRKKTTKKKSTKKKSTRSKKVSKPSPIPIDDGILRRLMDDMILNGQPEQVVRRQFARAYKAEIIDAHIAELRSRIARSSRFDHDVEVGASVARLRSIMSKSIEEGEYTVAIQAQKELSKMMSLYPGESVGARPESADQVNIIEQIEGHLRPLGLARADYPIEGVARIAADTIRRIESSQGAK